MDVDECSQICKEALLDPLVSILQAIKSRCIFPCSVQCRRKVPKFGEASSNVIGIIILLIGVVLTYLYKSAPLPSRFQRHSNVIWNSCPKCVVNFGLGTKFIGSIVKCIKQRVWIISKDVQRWGCFSFIQDFYFS